MPVQPPTDELPQQITIIQPDEGHIHFRDGNRLADVIKFTAVRFGRALVMPNLLPPLVTVASVLAYRKRIIELLGPQWLTHFNPLMTLYLTDRTTPEDIRMAKESGLILAGKLYPAGATTNSDDGVTDIENLYPAFEAAQELQFRICFHGEVTYGDVFNQEPEFIDKTLTDVHSRFPRMPITFEHISTEKAVRYVESVGGVVGATITPQHLLITRNDILKGGIRPHYFCFPVAQTEDDRLALIEAATSGKPYFYLGSDSAPHAIGDKECACGKGGIFTADQGIEIYADIFDSVGKLEMLEGFASRFFAQLFGLTYNRRTITLEKKPWVIPKSYAFDRSIVVPYGAGNTRKWRLKSVNPEPKLG